MQSGKWLNIANFVDRHKQLLELMIAKPEKINYPFMLSSFINNARMMPYIQDKPLQNRWFQNQLSLIFKNNLTFQVDKNFDVDLSENKILKIGYIASTLRRHSVGWLSRWLFKCHDKTKFEIYIYIFS
jgi:predicted O-linked N-acetylglucosamine transferase (SPINDLY family)